MARRVFLCADRDRKIFARGRAASVFYGGVGEEAEAAQSVSTRLPLNGAEKRAKKEIRHTLDTINGAFEKLLDDFYQDKTFDVLSDASVLQSMLAREGLTASDFRQDED